MSSQREAVSAMLSDLVDLWRARHGTPVARFDVTADGRHVSGAVLTRAQAGEIAMRLPDDVSLNLQILEDRSEVPPLGWMRPVGALAPLYRGADLGRLTTEVLGTDGAVRALEREGGAVLVQADDDTLGWALATDLTVADAGKTEVLVDGERIPAQTDTIVRLWDAARPFVEARTPYVLGGRSDGRADCSGLVSLVFRRATGAILPRHSMDQRRLGERASRAEARPGDLIFARLGDTNIPHVGLLLPGDRGLDIVHASQRAGHAVRQPEAEFLEGYRFMAVRRVLGDV
ncbi:MAG: hypothetical protein AMXMBFR64_29250 [Myxococcales bacterium]